MVASEEEDPFDLRADLDDFEEKLIAKIRADQKKRVGPVDTTTRKARPSLKHLADPTVKQQIIQLMQLKDAKWVRVQSTDITNLTITCHCGSTATRGYTDQMLAWSESNTAAYVNDQFAVLDHDLRQACKCKQPRPPLRF